MKKHNCPICDHSHPIKVPTPSEIVRRAVQTTMGEVGWTDAKLARQAGIRTALLRRWLDAETDSEWTSISVDVGARLLGVMGKQLALVIQNIPPEEEEV